jgi:hypothetical protein
MEKRGETKQRVVRALGRLVTEGKLDKRREGRSSKYRPLLRPKEFDTFSYLTDLRSRTSGHKMNYDWQVGGGVTHVASGTLVGFPDITKFPLRGDENFALSRILVRFSELYSALMDLRDMILLRRCGLDSKFSDSLLREVLLSALVANLTRDSATIEILDKVSPLLGVTEEIIKELYKQSEPGAGHHDPASLDNGPTSFDLTMPFHSLLKAKTYLRAEGIDPDKHTLLELAEKLRRIDEKIEKFTDQAFQSMNTSEEDGIRSVRIPEELSEQEALIARSYAVKIAEHFSSNGLREMQDMAVVMTRHPATMETQTTTEHTLYDFIESVREFEAEEFSGLQPEQVAKTLGERFGELYWRLPLEEVESLKEQPWLRKQLVGHVDEFFQEYRSARNKTIEIERELDL